MTSELIRLRVDKALLAQAETVCQRHGYELFEVVRSLIAQIVRDDAIPLDMSRAAPTSALEGSNDFERKVWTPLKAQVDAEVLAQFIQRIIATCSTRIEQLRAEKGSGNKIATLEALREQALRDQDNLSLNEPNEVRRALAAYGKLAAELRA